MKKGMEFLYAVLAGMMIAMGGIVFLSVESRILGALLFCVGLFTVCTFRLNLFTGKVGYLFEHPPAYLGFLALVWLGNLAGTTLMGYAVRLTRIGPAVAESASALCEIKLSDNLLSIFILAVLCNILMFIAVDGFNRNPHELGKYLGLLFGVVVFILCGFEHCVANMFYFAVADAWSLKTLLYLAVMTLGNAAGGVLLPLCRMWKSTVASPAV